MKENNEKKMKDEDEISKLIKAFPKDIDTYKKNELWQDLPELQNKISAL